MNVQKTEGKSSKKKASAKKVAERIAEGAVGLPPAAQEIARKVLADFPGLPDAPSVTSPQSAMMPQRKDTKVNLTLKGLDKSGRNAVYTGAAISLRFPIGAFENKTPPATLDMGGVAGPKAPKVAETPEARKARLKAAPKPTLAERAAKAEERAASLRAKLAAASATAEQPAL